MLGLVLARAVVCVVVNRILKNTVALFLMDFWNKLLAFVLVEFEIAPFAINETFAANRLLLFCSVKVEVGQLRLAFVF